MLLLDIVQKLEKEGQNVVLRSGHEKFKPEANIYVVDTLGTNSFNALIYENPLMLKIESMLFLALLICILLPHFTIFLVTCHSLILAKTQEHI